MGSHRFAAQYLQNPVPADGNLIKAIWLKIYAEPIDLGHGYIIQSWDTGNKAGPNSAYSCCITALVRGNDIYIRSRRQVQPPLNVGPELLCEGDDGRMHLDCPDDEQYLGLVPFVGDPWGAC